MKAQFMVILVNAVLGFFCGSSESAEPTFPYNWAENFLTNLSSSLDYRLWSNELLELGNHYCFLGTRPKLRGHLSIFAGRMWCPLQVDFSGKSLSFDKTMAKLLAVNDFMNQMIINSGNGTQDIEVLSSLKMEDVFCSVLKCPTMIAGDANRL